MPRTPMLLVLAFSCAAGCASLEDRLLYHPVRCAKADYRPPPPPLQDVELRTADGTIHARWCPHPHATGAILFCHGNAGNLAGRGRLVRELYDQLHESVLIFDYPGYGHSDGSPSEAGCYSAAEAAYRWLTEVQHVPPERIVLYGESLGGGVAVDLASRLPHRALVLVRTFASVPDVAQAQFAPLPVRSLVTSRFDSEAKIARCARPTLIAQADQDQLVPFEHGERLRTASGKAELYRLQGLGHNDALPVEFFVELKTFLRTQASPERAELNSPGQRPGSAACR